MQVMDYVDKNGILRRVLVPDGEGVKPSEGIPISINLDSLYAHMPVSFLAELYASLRAVGLVEPVDFGKPGAPEQTRAALLSVVKHDTADILAIAKEQMVNYGR